MRPHVVFPDELQADFRKALLETYPGSGDAYIPIDPANWETITDGMAQTTQPGFTIPLDRKIWRASTLAARPARRRLWGMTPRWPNLGDPAQCVVCGCSAPSQSRVGGCRTVAERKQELLSARIGAQVVSAYVEKQRRLANNLQPSKAPQRQSQWKWVRCGRLPDANAKDPADREVARIHAGRTSSSILNRVCRKRPDQALNGMRQLDPLHQGPCTNWAYSCRPAGSVPHEPHAA